MKKVPPPVSAAYLQRVTTHYLERYGSSRGNLRRLLMKRVRRSSTIHGTDPEEGAALVEAELDRIERLGWLDDGQYARDRARAMHRRGSGARKIRAALQARQVSQEHIDAALEALAEGGRDPELEAARTFARKRSMGPWRRQPSTDERVRRELGRMGRAGFSYALAQRVVQAASPDDLDEGDGSG